MNQFETTNDSVPDEGKQYLVFKEGPFTLALAIENIKRVHEAFTVPQRRPGTRLIDIHRITGMGSKIPVGFWVEMQIEKGHYLMPINNVEGIREMNLAVPMSYPEVLKKEQMDYISGLFFDGFRMIVELDLKALSELTEGENALLQNLKKIRKKKSCEMSSGLNAENENAGAQKGPLRETGKKSAERRILFFKTDDRVWGLEFLKIIKIINKDEIHQVPGIGEKVIGVAYYEEKAVPVIIPGKNDVDDQKGKDIEKIILTESSRGMVGFGCDRIIRIANEETEEKLENGPEHSINMIEPELVVDNLI